MQGSLQSVAFVDRGYFFLGGEGAAQRSRREELTTHVVCINIEISDERAVN